MNKEEILEKSRIENKGEDTFEKEVIKEGGNIGSIVAGILATIFFTVQIYAGGGMNYGLYAVVIAIPAIKFTYKAIKLKRKHEILTAIFFILFTLMLSIAHIYSLITKYGIY